MIATPTEIISLNFIELLATELNFTIYRKPYDDTDTHAKESPSIRRRRLPLNSDLVESEWKDFWITPKKTAGYFPYECRLSTNYHLTNDLLYQTLVQSIRSRLRKSQFQLNKGFRRTVDLILYEHKEGVEKIWLEPYFLKDTGKFGFLLDFSFSPTPNFRGSKRAQQLSLSLDRGMRSNRNFYADRYSKLGQFFSQYHSKIFPLTLGKQRIGVSKTLTQLPSSLLESKDYVVGSGHTTKSQFMGIKRHGPLMEGRPGSRLYFVYPPQQKGLSHDLYRALRGDSFPTFPGLEKMFGLKLDQHSVRGIDIAEFRPESIKNLKDKIVDDAGNHTVLPVVLTPFSSDDDESENSAYWQLKHTFLRANLPLQVVSTKTVKDRNQLKWAISNIALQIFCKLGGTPWRVKDKEKPSLIIGIGQAHERTDGKITKYFAYTVLTDSTGAFEKVLPLGQSASQDKYIVHLKDALASIISERLNRFDNIVLHATFSIRRVELNAISEVLDSLKSAQNSSKEFVALKFNEHSKFFGYALDHNSRVPYESTLLQLSKSEFLIWFEGLQYQKPTVQQRIGRPMHVRFEYPKNDLGDERKRHYLQQAVNLSGANWRGFNSKAVPISIHYARLVAKFHQHFSESGLSPIETENTIPWFI